MGYDISYHPIKEQEINDWYFNIMPNFKSINLDKVEELAEKFNKSDLEFLKETYHYTLNTGLNTELDKEFDLTHGYFIAVIQGLFRKYFYTRGAAFSFLINEKSYFKNYTKGWKDILEFTPKQKVYNHLRGNYSSGVFIPYNMVVKLLADYDNDTKIKQDLDTFYSDNRINIFLTALKFAKENELGLLEATEVVEPNPYDLNKSNCYSYLLNCDVEGAFLYRDIALDQIREIEKRKGLKEGEVSNKVTYEINNYELPKEKLTEVKKKKCFFLKLFG